MREVKRNIHRPSLRLKRSSDGRLLPSSGDDDIGDIWAEQHRIRLREAMQEDRRKAEQKQRRRAWFKRAKPADGKGSGKTSGVKEIEIRLSLPKFSVPSKRSVQRLLRRVPRPKLSKKQWIVAGCVSALLVAVMIGPLLSGPKPKKSGTEGGHGALGAHTKKPETPSYATVLPAGKTIEQLGGWGRVSPPDRDPVFAYADAIAGVKVIVSEQPLPDDFTTDTSSKVEKLAEQFNATQALPVTDSGSVAYLGTSVHGPQSVVASKEGLLVLIKSNSGIPNASWVSYIDALVRQ